MKKLIVTTVAAFAAVGMATSGALACDAAEASEKFQKRTSQLATPGAVPDAEIGNAWAKMNDGGTALASGDYDKACDIYDQIATDYGLEK